MIRNSNEHLKFISTDMKMKKKIIFISWTTTDLFSNTEYSIKEKKQITYLLCDKDYDTNKSILVFSTLYSGSIDVLMKTKLTTEPRVPIYWPSECNDRYVSVIDFYTVYYNGTTNYIYSKTVD